MFCMGTSITPFSCSPDPTGVYMTTSFKTTLYKCHYAVEHKQGLAVILGDPGVGKSTLMRYLYAQFSALPNFRCSFTPNPNFKSDFAMLKKIALDLGQDAKRSMLHQQSMFEDFLTEQYAGDSMIVAFIDEAQRLDSAQLELIRTLLNFETDKEKLIQIVLAGNLDLREKLVKKKHKAVLSRVFAPSLLGSLTYEEMCGMLKVRCEREQLGWPFTDEALQAVYNWSGGIPRHILQACEFSHAQTRDLDLPAVTVEVMESVIEELRIRSDEQVA